MNNTPSIKQLTIDVSGKVLQRIRDGKTAKTWIFPEDGCVEYYVIVEEKLKPNKI